MIDSMIQVINSFKNPKDEMDTTLTMDLIRVHPLNHAVYYLNFGFYH